MSDLNLPVVETDRNKRPDQTAISIRLRGSVARGPSLAELDMSELRITRRESDRREVPDIPSLCGSGVKFEFELASSIHFRPALPLLYRGRSTLVRQFYNRLQ